MTWSILLLAFQIISAHQNNPFPLKRFPRQIIRTAKKAAFTRPADDNDVLSFSDSSSGISGRQSSASNDATQRNPIANSLMTLMGAGMRFGVNLMSQFMGFNGGSPNLSDAVNQAFPVGGGSSSGFGSSGGFSSGAVVRLFSNA